MYVESKVALNLPKSRILNLIREPGSLNKYHPFCKRNDAIKWPGTNSIDELEYLNGLTFERNFFNWHENGYDLIIGKKNKSKMAQVNWVIEGNNEISSLRVRINPKYVISLHLRINLCKICHGTCLLSLCYKAI